MRRRDQRDSPRRRPGGKVLVMAALVFPVMLGGMALSVDYGVLGVAQDQLQTSSDAAALSAAMQLSDGSRVQDLLAIPILMGNAQSFAKTVAQQNLVLAVAPVIKSNLTNDPAGDVVVGYLNPNSPSSALDTSLLSTPLYNAVQVKTYRDANHGGIVPTFFGGALGLTGTAVSATSIAIAQPYSIVGFKSVNNQNAMVLPLGLDLASYNSMINSNNRSNLSTSDTYSYDPVTHVVSTAPDGIYESSAFPVGASPGNFGLLNIGTGNLSSQITSGLTPADLSGYSNGVMQLDPNTGKLPIGGTPGIKASLKTDFAAIVGNAVSMPIYDPAQTTGQGANTIYTIVGFAGVRVMYVNFQGNPKYVVVQPALVTDPTAIPGVPLAGWTSGGVVRLYLAR